MKQNHTHKINQKKSSRHSAAPFSILLILIFFVLPQSFYGYIIHEGDSTKNSFPMNDPRNPNCPCHKYQKLADEEFKKLMNHQNEERNNEVSSPKKESGLVVSSHILRSKNYSVHPLKRKKFSKRNSKIRRILCVNEWQIWKRLKDPSACFKWR